MTKQVSSAIHTLIEIAIKESNQAAEALGNANKLLKESEKNLNMLLNYRNDYTIQLVQNSKKGLFAESYQNFQGFLSKLNQAITGQQAVVETCRQRLADQRQYWQECERKKLSYGVLVTQAEARAHRVELKKDQKLMDEHALRQCMKKAHSR
jgi:flagellar FliJ protein